MRGLIHWHTRSQLARMCNGVCEGGSGVQCIVKKDRVFNTTRSRAVFSRRCAPSSAPQMNNFAKSTPYKTVHLTAVHFLNTLSTFQVNLFRRGPALNLLKRVCKLPQVSPLLQLITHPFRIVTNGSSRHFLILARELSLGGGEVTSFFCTLR